MKEETSSGGIVFKKTKKGIVWLVVQHSQHKGWVFPKGLTSDHDGENDLKTTALREVREEGGIKAKIVNDRPFFNKYYYQYKGEKIHKKVYYFLMEYVSGSELNHDSEISAALWLSENEALVKLTFKNDKKNFKEAERMLDLLKKKHPYEEKLAFKAILEFKKDRKAGTLFVGKRGRDLLTFEKK